MPTLLTETREERDDAVAQAERRLKNALKAGESKPKIDKAFAALEKARRQRETQQDKDRTAGRLKQELALEAHHDAAKALRIKKAKVTEEIYREGPECVISYCGVRVVVKPMHTDMVVTRTALEALRRALQLLMNDCERRAALAMDDKPAEVPPTLVAQLRDELRLAIRHDCAVVVDSL